MKRILDVALASIGLAISFPLSCVFALAIKLEDGGPIFFNVLQFAMIYLGLKALEHAKGDRSYFKEGLKTGVAISFVYGLTASIFFVIVLVIVGTKWLASEPGATNAPLSRILLGAFLGLFLGALLFGLIYSTVLSFFLAKRRSED